MTILQKIAALWRKDSASVVYGWLSEGAESLGPADEGTRYLEVSCLDLGLKYERQRFGDRRPVLQSLITWPSEDTRITVSRTLGPSSFTALHDGEFARLIQSDVALTGDLPMNSGAVDIAIGLLAAPGASLLDTATAILDDLAELTQAPQLTAAAPVADKILNGVDKLLGNDDTKGILAFQTSIQADGLRGGHLVITDLPTNTGSTDRLRVKDDNLQMRDDAGDWVAAAGFNFVVLRVTLLPSKPKRWRELGELASLVKKATGQLASARSPEDVAAAGSAIQVAMDAAGYEPNLTISDRDAAQDSIEAAWQKAIIRRAILETGSKGGLAPDDGEPTGHAENTDDPGPVRHADVGGVLQAARVVAGRLELRRMRAVPR